MLKQIESLGGIGHWEIDLKTGENKWSDQFYRILGLDPNQVKPSIDLALSVVHPDDRELARSHYMNSIRTGQPFKVEKRIIHSNGEVRYIISEGIVELDADKKATRLFGVFKDITQEKQQEIELQKKPISKSKTS